jgi:hypothetical protein
MSTKFLTSIPFVVCKSPFQIGLKDKSLLPQRQRLADFIRNNNITDVSFDHERHAMICMIHNHDYCSLDDLKKNVVAASQLADQYFYLAVNKFCIYSTQDLTVTDDDHDVKLINYCHASIMDEFDLLESHYSLSDRGTIGNWVHPVTQMFFKRHD